MAFSTQTTWWSWVVYNVCIYVCSIHSHVYMHAIYQAYHLPGFKGFFMLSGCNLSGNHTSIQTFFRHSQRHFPGFQSHSRNLTHTVTYICTALSLFVHTGDSSFWYSLLTQWSSPLLFQWTAHLQAMVDYTNTYDISAVTVSVTVQVIVFYTTRASSSASSSATMSILDASAIALQQHHVES